MNIDYEKKILLEKLYSLQRFGIKPGLERTLELLQERDNPHLKIKTIHIAGTNGKGSVAAIISSILTEAGYKTGLYSSPHIKHFNERIRINGKMISDDEIITNANYFMQKANEINATFFEITTAMAFNYFCDNNVDIAIIETGMGGRFDSTNVIKPMLSIITNISLEHKEYLGDTLEKIANEKAGIIKPEVPVILGNIKDEIMSVFENKSNNIINSQEIINIENIQLLKDLKYMVELKMDGIKYDNLKLNIGGYAQIENLITSLAAIDSLFKDYFISTDNIKSGLKNIQKNTGIISRIQIVNRTLPIIIDVAHNPDAILNLVNTINKSEYSDYKWNVLLALMNDKDADLILEILKPITNELIICKTKNERTADTKLLKKQADKHEIKSLIIDDPSDAYKFLKTKSKPSIVVGSFYLIGDIFNIL